MIKCSNFEIIMKQTKTCIFILDLKMGSTRNETIRKNNKLVNKFIIKCGKGTF